MMPWVEWLRRTIAVLRMISVLHKLLNNLRSLDWWHVLWHYRPRLMHHFLDIRKAFVKLRLRLIVQILIHLRLQSANLVLDLLLLWIQIFGFLLVLTIHLLNRMWTHFWWERRWAVNSTFHDVLHLLLSHRRGRACFYRDRAGSSF